MHKYKLTIAYDGTEYIGWQVQANRENSRGGCKTPIPQKIDDFGASSRGQLAGPCPADKTIPERVGEEKGRDLAAKGRFYGVQEFCNPLSIQSIVQKACQTALRTEIDLTGAGRTDAGVHALGQVAHFSSPQSVDLPRLKASLNGLLPLDIRICDIEPVAANFHARYSATGKIYRYYLQLDQYAHPFTRLYAYHVPHPVDVELLQNSAAIFTGTHDFTSFANAATQGSAAKDPVRTLKRLDVVTTAYGLYLEFEGDGFLYRMVRNITGTLLDASCGKIPLINIPHILAARDRRQAGKAAPAHGLFLVKVNYL